MWEGGEVQAADARQWRPARHHHHHHHPPPRCAQRRAIPTHAPTRTALAPTPTYPAPVPDPCTVPRAPPTPPHAPAGWSAGLLASCRAAAGWDRRGPCTRPWRRRCFRLPTGPWPRPRSACAASSRHPPCRACTRQTHNALGTRLQGDAGRAGRAAPEGPVLHGKDGVLRAKVDRAVGQVHGHTLGRRRRAVLSRFRDWRRTARRRRRRRGGRGRRRGRGVGRRRCSGRFLGHGRAAGEALAHFIVARARARKFGQGGRTDHRTRTPKGGSLSASL